MDTNDEFIFLNPVIAERFNPLAEGEYIVIQTRTGSWRLHLLLRTFSYWQAENRCSMENMGADYSHYSIRIVHGGKLHRVDINGYPAQISKEQDWQLHPDYYNARYVNNEDCEIETCPCSYPVFWSWQNVAGAGGQIVRDWRALTCLVEDSARMVKHCPNCASPLLIDEDNDPENEEDGWFGWGDEIPEVCEGCQYYSVEFAGCAIHPSGVEGDFCADYSQEQAH